jgi:stage II sporulation protein D
MLRRLALVGLLPVLTLGGLALGRMPWLSILQPASPGSPHDPLLEALLHGEAASDAGTKPGARQTEVQAQSVQPTKPRGFPVPKVPPAGASPNPRLRVALLSQAPIRSVRSSGSATCRTADGRHLPLDQLPIWLERGAERWFCEAPGEGSMLLNGRAYPGLIEFHRQDAGWLAVNVLDLERYVASVVGAEMPSHWSSEALKAQAVAARSYALVHLVRPANPLYNLGDTTRWQVYGGQATRTDATWEATAATRGMVLSYRGGLVESLYAASSEISREAHGHLGASMSQTGAQELAREGLRFNEILGRYYTGAALARLRTDG